MAASCRGPCLFEGSEFSRVAASSGTGERLHKKVAGDVAFFWAPRGFWLLSWLGRRIGIWRKCASPRPPRDSHGYQSQQLSENDRGVQRQHYLAPL